MVAEEVVITLSGGAPWGFRLQGGAEHNKPLQVAKVRKRSKACRAGLREADELVSINDSSCARLSHAQAMNLIDSSPGTLHIRVKRAPTGFQSVVLLTRAPSPRIDKEYRSTLHTVSTPDAGPTQTTVREVHQGALIGSPERVVVAEHRGREGLTSPQGSEAYYGETDSDADVASEKHRRHRHRPSSPPGRVSPEGTSGYDNAHGVARREVVYQPPAQQLQGEWSYQTETSTENSSFSADDQGPQDGPIEEDNGYQEPHTLPPLVSPEGARGALQLASRKQLVPMVGPVDNPVAEELTVTYMDKAKQAKLHRGDTQQEKHVKEARTKCKTIACLLTDAPNPHSKGVLMFKKRRQRSKKYTLTSFGCVEEDTTPHDSQEEGEDGLLPGSESEFDEDGLPVAPDPTWDGEYLDMLEKKASAAPVVVDGEAEDPGLTATSGKGAQLFEQQRRRAAEHAKRAAARQLEVPPPMQPAETPTAGVDSMGLAPTNVETLSKCLAQPFAPAQAHAVGMMNGGVVPERPMTAPAAAAPQAQFPSHPLASPPPTELPEMPSSNVLNRTARPFAPGFISHRSSTAPVVFRPNVAKKTRPATAPIAIAPPYSSPPVEKYPEPTPVLSTRPASASTYGAFSAPTTPIAPYQPSMPPPVAMAQSVPSTPSISATPVAVGVTPGHATLYQQRAPVSAATPTGRTGILQEAMRNRSRKPLFTRPEEKKKNSPNPDLLSMVQRLDERPWGGHARGYESAPEDESYSLGAETRSFTRSKLPPPPVAPKPRVVASPAPIHLGEGKGAEIFARKQSRMDLYVVDNAPQHPPVFSPTSRPRDPSPTPSLPSHWKYSPNIRAPPPIGYNPLLSPSCPPVAHRGPKPFDPKASKRGGRHKEGIKALDAMRRQPYQLNPAMFSFSPGPYQGLPQREGPSLVGSSLSSPRQIPVKTARVLQVRRFSTPTPMSGPTTLTPTVIAPRSSTSLAEPLCHSDLASPTPLTPLSPPPRPALTGAPPPLPQLSSGPFQSSVYHPAPPPTQSSVTYGGLQAAKQFQSAPDLGPPRSPAVQVPKPRFVASRMGIQPNVWRPGYTHH